MLKMSKSSMHGLLKTLENCSVVEQREDRQSKSGPRIYNLAAYVWNTGLRRLALPVMQHLAVSIGETVFLGRVEQRGVRVIESKSAGSEQMFPHVAMPRGTRVPLGGRDRWSCRVSELASGKASGLLQNHPLPYFTERSITDPDSFSRRLKRQCGRGLHWIMAST